MKLIKFEKHNCPGCVLVGNYLDDQSIKYDSINAEENPDLAGEYGIMSTPVTILLDDEGNEVKRSIGFKPDDLEVMISQL